MPPPSDETRGSVLGNDVMSRLRGLVHDPKLSLEQLAQCLGELPEVLLRGVAVPYVRGALKQRPGFFQEIVVAQEPLLEVHWRFYADTEPHEPMGGTSLELRETLAGTFQLVRHGFLYVEDHIFWLGEVAREELCAQMLQVQKFQRDTACSLEPLAILQGALETPDFVLEETVRCLKDMPRALQPLVPGAVTRVLERWNVHRHLGRAYTETPTPSVQFSFQDCTVALDGMIFYAMVDISFDFEASRLKWRAEAEGNKACYEVGDFDSFLEAVAALQELEDTVLANPSEYIDLSG